MSAEKECVVDYAKVVAEADDLLNDIRSIRSQLEDYYDELEKIATRELTHDILDEFEKRWKERINNGDSISAIDLFEEIRFEQVMSSKNIYDMFCVKCSGLKDNVRRFMSHGPNSIILLMKDYSEPLLFTVLNSKKGFWKLEPFNN